MDIDTGNAHDVDTGGTGWFIGFSPWTQGSVRDFRHVPKDQPVTGLCVKWYHHEPGHESGGKPVSEGRTMSILVTGDSHFELDFCESPDFAGNVRTVVFKREGDFAVWGEGLYHRWRCIKRATIGTVRWTPAA
jgi:hypothetical protein